MFKGLHIYARVTPKKKTWDNALSHKYVSLHPIQQKDSVVHSLQKQTFIHSCKSQFTQGGCKLNRKLST